MKYKKICFVFTLSLFLCACQATPDVSHKDDGAKVAVGESDSGAKSYDKVVNEIPSTLKKSIKNSSGNAIDLNADVVIPESVNDKIYQGTLKKNNEIDKRKVKNTLFQNEDMQEMSATEAKTYGDFAWYSENKMVTGDSNTLFFYTDNSYDDELNNLSTSISIKDEDQVVREKLSTEVIELMNELDFHQVLDSWLPFKAESGMYFYNFEMTSEINGVKAISASNIGKSGEIIISEKGISSINIISDYNPDKQEEIDILPFDKIIDIVSTLLENNTISPIQSGQPITLIELKYLISDNDGDLIFKPVWSFQVPYFFKGQENDDFNGNKTEIYLCLDAQTGEIEYYGIGG